MAKKVSSTLTAVLFNNMDKGGAWLAQISLADEGMEAPYKVETTAWKNPSAAKRWVKERVQALTPRKSIKLVPSPRVDEKGKPVSFAGQIGYKREL